MVPIKKVEQGIANYLDKELMPKLPETGVQKVIAGVAISIGLKKFSGEVMKARESTFVQMLDIIGEDGSIDVETLRDELKKQIGDSGFKIDLPVVGTMTFKRSDIDSLYEFIMSA